MADNGSRQKAKGSGAAAARAAAALEKATAREKKAQKKLAEASKTLGVVTSELIGAETGGAGERKARRKMRAAVAALVRAKRKLKRAQRKHKKVAAKQLKKNRVKAAATGGKTKPAHTTPRRPLSVVRSAPRKHRRITRGPSAPASALAVEEGTQDVAEATHREEPGSLD